MILRSIRFAPDGQGGDGGQGAMGGQPSGAPSTTTETPQVEQVFEVDDVFGPIPQEHADLFDDKGNLKLQPYQQPQQPQAPQMDPAVQQVLAQQNQTIQFLTSKLDAVLGRLGGQQEPEDDPVYGGNQDQQVALHPMVKREIEALRQKNLEMEQKLQVFESQMGQRGQDEQRQLQQRLVNEASSAAAEIDKQLLGGPGHITPEAVMKVQLKYRIDDPRKAAVIIANDFMRKAQAAGYRRVRPANQTAPSVLPNQGAGPQTQAPNLKPYTMTGNLDEDMQLGMRQLIESGVLGE